MDFILLSAVSTEKDTLRELFVSYDIWCQYTINFKARMEKMAERLQLPESLRLCGGIPKCHCKGHKFPCQCLYSMNIQPGVGRTDGEGIERTWSQLNHAASSTKEMLPGARHDMLDRRFGAHNWQKLVGLGRFGFNSLFWLINEPYVLGHHLHARLAKAHTAYENQSRAHEEFTSVLPNGCAERWLKQVKAWEESPSLISPYYDPVSCKFPVQHVCPALTHHR